MTLPIEPKTPVEAAAAAGEDPIAELRAIYDSVLAQQTEDFPIHGYDGRLIVRYRILAADRAREILNAPGETTEQRHAQFLLEACDEILYRYNDGEVRRFPQGKVTYRLELGADGTEPSDATLDQVMGWPPATDARQIVLDMFGGKWGELNRHAVAVDRWMTTLFDRAEQAAAGGQPVTR